MSSCTGKSTLPAIEWIQDSEKLHAERFGVVGLAARVGRLWLSSLAD